jgi:glutaredoxin
MRDFVLYVLKGCPYCEGAIKLLNQKREKYNTIVVGPSQKQSIKQQNGMNTFPQVFLRRKVQGQEHIRKVGGFTDLQRMLT